MKFSIIIPVYNVEKYIEKCLKSVLDQSYTDFEAIIINDGSTDYSQNIIEKYVKEDSRLHGYQKTNGGLSDARNYGLQYVTGDYILFLDSDDYLEKDLLRKLHSSLDKNPVDLIRYSIQKVDEKGKNLDCIISEDFVALEMEKALDCILKGDLVEPAWIYAYKAKFFLDNGFRYPSGYYHEDYGLTPYVLLKAKTISSISYIGLNYVQRVGSIMNSNNYQKTIKKTNDVYSLFIQLRDKIETLDIGGNSKRRMLSFIVRVLMEQLLFLKDLERENYISKIESLKVEQYFVQRGIKGIIKKCWAKVHFHSYCNHFYGGANE